MCAMPELSEDLRWRGLMHQVTDDAATILRLHRRMAACTYLPMVRIVNESVTFWAGVLCSSSHA